MRESEIELPEEVPRGLGVDINAILAQMSFHYRWGRKRKYLMQRCYDTADAFWSALPAKYKNRFTETDEHSCLYISSDEMTMATSAAYHEVEQALKGRTVHTVSAQKVAISTFLNWLRYHLYESIERRRSRRINGLYYEAACAAEGVSVPTTKPDITLPKEIPHHLGVKIADIIEKMSFSLDWSRKRDLLPAHFQMAANHIWRALPACYKDKRDLGFHADASYGIHLNQGEFNVQVACATEKMLTRLSGQAVHSSIAQKKKVMAYVEMLLDILQTVLEGKRTRHILGKYHSALVFYQQQSSGAADADDVLHVVPSEAQRSAIQ